MSSATLPAELASPSDARRQVDRLLDLRAQRTQRSVRMARRFGELKEYLAIADQVTGALEQLSDQLFEQLLAVVQDKLSIALVEILEQPIALKAEADFKRGAATVDFWIDRGGNKEDVLRGQGGSVANILSVGLRMFALTTLDPKQHRPFLVLDEQDCWLKPELVPRLVKIVHDAGRELGFQIIMISHHDVELFERYADKIYQFVPQTDGSVQVRQVNAPPGESDEES